MKDNTDESLSLAQESYIASESLRITSRQLFIFFSVFIGYLVLGIIFLYTGDIVMAKFFFPYTIIIISIFLIYYYLRARGFYRIQKHWVRDFVESQYILLVSTTVPKGNTTTERIFSLCRLVFPELREDFAKYTVYFSDQIISYFRRLRGRKLIDYSKGTDFRVTSSYILDLALKAINGYFIVKDFKEKTVTIDELRQLKDVINGRKFRDNYYRLFVFRVICVRKKL